jgi:diguanylate cyclase (GGDEF)-like protein
LAIDLDGLKGVNDTHGHPAGDDVLRAVAMVLTTSLRVSDTAARFGGDEFGVILPQTSEARAVQVAQRLAHAVEKLVVGPGVKVTASIGVAGVVPSSDRAQTRASVIARADRALYRAKRDGGNRVAVDGVNQLFEA